MPGGGVVMVSGDRPKRPQPEPGAENLSSLTALAALTGSDAFAAPLHHCKALDLIG